MIVIESETMRLLINERETTCVRYDKEEKVAYVNYINALPQRIPDVTAISYTSESCPACLTYTEEDTL